MIKEKLLSGISRRSFLKGMTAVGATAALYGCGGGSGDGKSYNAVVSPQATPTFDKAVTVLMGTHPHNCGGRCPFKFYVKDYGKKTARIVKHIGIGDIPRDGSLDKDESITSIQTRACVRGYAQLKRTYSPDRIKYPLIQTKQRGDLSGFKRVSWDEAMTKVASMVQDVMKKYQDGTLPYIPMVAGPPNALHNKMMFAGMAFAGFAEGAGTALAQYLGPTILPTGSPSFENMLYATIGSVGVAAGLGGGNSVLNYQNSDFIIQWGADPAVKEPNKTFFLTKAKEKGVPIVTIDAKFTDTAAQLSTGFKKYNLPAFIQVRPQTDGALSAAMAYVIYKNNWHNDKFIRSYCYGFYPTQDVTGTDMNGKSFIALKAATVPTFSGYDPRISYPAYKGMYDQYGIDKILLAQPMSFGAMPLYPGQHPLLKQDSNGKYIFKDQPLHVPKGMSFVEYLTNLGNKVYAQQGGTGTPSADQAETAVLKWAEELTGVNAATIKNLANAIANAGDVFIENGNNGGQKTNNGMHNVWLTISLSAMCGHVTKLGGNLGVNSSDGMFNPVSFAGGNTYPDLGAANKNKYPFIAVDSNGFVNLVATGRDSRSADEFYMDNLSIYGIDLKDKINPKLEVDMVFGGYHITNSFNTCPNTNKAVNIFTQKKADGTYRIKYYVLYEQFMTPTAAYADVILPACSHHEKPFFTSGEATYYQNKLIDPMYDTKGDVDIDELLAKKLNDLGISVSYTKNGKTDEELLKDAWDTYATVDPSMEKPSFDKVKEMGYVQTSVTDASNPMAGMLPALLYLGVETGKIQFFSPFYFYRDKWDLDLSTFSNPVGPTDCNDPIDFTDTTKVSGKYRVAPKVQYIVPYEGYEQIKDGPKVGVSGRTYSMQFTTKHARNRAHTVYDNVALIKDQFDYPKRATMNPVDAAKRGIREGDKVYIYNDWGCMHVAVTLSERVNQGVVDLPHGVWYRAGNETYIAYYDVDLGNSKGQVQFNGKTYYKYEIPIDIGGSENGLTHDKNANCPRDPWCGQVGNNHFNGNICEISKTKPAN